MNGNKNKEKVVKYFIYCRKSSDSEDKKIASLPAQVRELKELAEKERLKIVGVYQESCSAFHPGRPLFNEMLARVRKGEANGIIVWAANRISRNSKDSGDFLYMMDLGEIAEVKAKGRTFYNTPEDKFSLNIDFTVAKKSSDDLSVVVMRGNREKFFERKEWGGVAKQGYLNFTDPLTKENKIMSDEVRFPLLKEAFSMMLNGKAPMETFNWLNETMGYRTRQILHHASGPMSRTSFYKLINDPFYAGLMQRRVDGDFCEETGVHEPMMSMEEFEMLQIRLGRKGRPHQSARQFPYKEVLHCGECGQSITCEEKWHIVCPLCKTKFAKSRKTNECPHCQLAIEEMSDPKLYCFVHYHCTRKKTELHCAQGSLNKRKLEEQMLAEIARYEIPIEFRDLAIKYLNELNDQENQQDIAIRKNIQKRLDLVNQQIKNVVAIRISPEYFTYDQEQKELYQLEEKRLLAERRVTEKKLADTDHLQENWIEQAKSTFDFVASARDLLENGTLADKTWVLSQLGSNLTIKDKRLELGGDKVYYLVEKGKKEALAAANEFEPRKYSELSAQMINLEPVLTAWRRERDSNPR